MQPDRYDRALYVIDIPAGTTAYQAKNRIYYGRSEYECKPLPDNEVRIRMLRTQIAQGAIIVESVVLGRSAVDEAPMPPAPLGAPPPNTSKDERTLWFVEHDPDLGERIQAGIRRAELVSRGKPLTFDEYQLKYSIKNVGLLNIVGGLVELQVSAEGRFAEGFRKKPLSSPEFKLYPDQEYSCPDDLRFKVESKSKFAPGALRLKWRLFLDNSPPSSGTVDLYDHLPESGKDSGE